MIDWYLHPEKQKRKQGGSNGKHIRQGTERNPERITQVEIDLTDGFG